MALGFSIAVGIDDGLGFALDRAITAGLDLTPAMRDIAGELEDAARARFERGVAPSGVPWKKSRRVEEEGGQTLVDSGDLVNSMTSNWGKDFAEAGPEASGGAARYAAIHQFGGTIRPRRAKALRVGNRFFGSVKIPARPYLGFDEPTERYAVDALLTHIARAFGSGGEAAA